MHLLLTDGLICPRCGPGFGLILRADTLNDRWVQAGGLGCPNCREVYPVVDGVGDLRPPPRASAPLLEPGTPPSPETVFGAQAMLGLEGGGGDLLLVGRAARYAPGLAERLPEMRVVAAGPTGAADPAPEDAKWSQLHIGVPFPFEARRLRGVLMEGATPRPLLREAARVVGSGHRVVVLEAGDRAGDILMASGLTLRLQEAGVVVAGR